MLQLGGAGRQGRLTGGRKQILVGGHLPDTSAHRWALRKHSQPRGREQSVGDLDIQAVAAELDQAALSLRTSAAKKGTQLRGELCEPRRYRRKMVKAARKWWGRGLLREAAGAAGESFLHERGNAWRKGTGAGGRFQANTINSGARSGARNGAYSTHLLASGLQALRAGNRSRRQRQTGNILHFFRSTSQCEQHGTGGHWAGAR